jgi:hypothetical protein
MNIRFLPLLLLPFLIVSYADAQEREFFFFSPYNMDVTYRQEAAPYIAHVEDNWKFYKLGIRLTQVATIYSISPIFSTWEIHYGERRLPRRF